nr:MAG TPA: hypothetical protein [Caudoviricetes sp.]
MTKARRSVVPFVISPTFFFCCVQKDGCAIWQEEAHFGAGEVCDFDQIISVPTVSHHLCC